MNDKEKLLAVTEGCIRVSVGILDRLKECLEPLQEDEESPLEPSKKELLRESNALLQQAMENLAKVVGEEL